MAVRTAWRVGSETPGRSLRTRLTVASLTSAWAAMSARRADRDSFTREP